MEDRPPPPPPPVVPPLLPFDDPWQLHTRSRTFERVVTAGEIVSLNHIRDMTGQRNIYLVRDGTKFGCSPDQVDGFKKYLSNLAMLIDQEGERNDLHFEWTSPLSGRQGRFFRLDGLRNEQALATFLYAALLRQLAHQGVQDMLGSSQGSTALPAESEAAATALATAATHLRQAAGVYEHLSAVMLPPLFAALKGDRPAEILGTLSSVMCDLCLAEAQALTAFRASQRPSSSAALVASLQAGAAELFEKAAKTIRTYVGDHTLASERLRRYIAIGSSLATARGHKMMALQLHTELQAGPAERACLDALQLLSTSMNAADVDASWRAVLQQEIADVERIKKPIESDRLIVYCQALPREAPPLPAAKVLVTALPYTVEKIHSTTAEIAMQT